MLAHTVVAPCDIEEPLNLWCGAALEKQILRQPLHHRLNLGLHSCAAAALLAM